MKKIVLGTLAGLFTCLYAVAQLPANLPKKALGDSIRKPPLLQLIARNYGDSVVLRWAPSEPLFWKAANKAGYVIKRYTTDRKQIPRQAQAQTMTSQPLTPWSLEEWKRQAKPQDSLAAVCAQLVHGKTRALNLAKGLNIQQAFDQKIENENRHSFSLYLADISAFYANGLGLRWVDKTIEKGKSYVYVVYALTDKKLYPSDTVATVINTQELPPPSEMPSVDYEVGDRGVRFSWSRQLAGMQFSAYYYERSEDGGKTYQRRSNRPFFQPVVKKSGVSDQDIILTDSLPRNYKLYHYRIVGITPFGDLGKPTPTMPVMGRDKKAPAAPVGLKAENIKSNDVRLEWKKPNQESDFDGFLIGRGDNLNGPFLPLSLTLLPKTATSFVDTAAIAWGINYYVVSAVDTAGNAAASVPAFVVMIDTIAPKRPSGLQGRIDTSGIVSLAWKLGKEPDLMGYLIYAANSADHTFVPLTPDFVADSTFTDSITLRTLTEKIYYRIVAFDKNRNPSPYSQILELKKPDKIPPVPAVFTNFRVTDTTLSVTWSPSSSHDLAAQVLYRREGEGEWVEYAKLGKTQTIFIDKKVKKRTWYEYSLVAVDDDSLRSEKSFPIRARVYDSGIRKKIDAFTAKVISDGNGIQLSWKYPTVEECRYVLYRSYNGSGLLTYKSFPASNLSFVDTSLPKGKYEYALKAIYPDGGESPLVKTVISKQ